MAKKKDTPNWILGLLIDTFHLEKVKPENMPIFEEWLHAEGILTIEEKETLAELQVELAENVDNWEEEALKMNFIAFILGIVKYKGERYRAFFDKRISAVIEGHTLTTAPDMVVALRVEDLMKKPYFCFHEYKPSKPDRDPRGQLMADMLIAQAINHGENPIYGCYVMGKYWYFMMLAKKQFSISDSFDATKTAELYQIIFILRKFKLILEEMLVFES